MTYYRTNNGEIIKIVPMSSYHVHVTHDENHPHYKYAWERNTLKPANQHTPTIEILSEVDTLIYELCEEIRTHPTGVAAYALAVTLGLLLSTYTDKPAAFATTVEIIKRNMK